MRSLTITLALLATTFTSTQAISQVVNSNYTVELNKTQILRLPKVAGSIIIGNPDIADVSVHSVDTLFLVGRGYGQTNLIVLDKFGNTLIDSDLNVVHTLPSEGVRVYNAKERETYSCIPYCQPSPVLGDSPTFIGRNTNSEPELTPLATLFQATADGGNQQESTAQAGGNADFAGGNGNNFAGGEDNPSTSDFGSGF